MSLDGSSHGNFPLTEAEYKELQQLGNFDTKRQVG
jgi:hypothetical protein